MKLIFLLTLLIVSSAWADVPTDLEPGYAEAILAFNGKDYNKAIVLLDPLLKQSPNIPELLELKALALKSMANEKGSAEVYQQLIKIKSAEGKPKKETGPYYFELGLIRFHENKLTEARNHLHEALRADFNPAASHFFLGLIHFKSAQWASAESNFSAVATADIESLKPTANFYLGQVAIKSNYASGATQYFVTARSQAKEQMADPKLNDDTKKTAQQIYDATEKALEPFQKSGMFGSLSLISGYDSNVLSVPSSQAGIVTTGQGSMKETLQVGVGYMSSPMKAFQFVPSYRGSMNYNINRDTKNGEFMAHNASLYVTRNALSRTSYGLKLEGIYTFQNQPTGESTGIKYTPYSLIGSFGPYLRHELKPRLLLTFEVFVQPQKNYLDASSAENVARSGLQEIVRVSLKNEKGERFWNPGISLIGDNNATKGTEYKYKAVTLELSDAMRLSDRFSLTPSGSFGLYSYGDRQPTARNDKMIIIDMAAAYKAGPRYALLGDLQYVNNMSNVTDVYQYNRFVLSLGIAYNF